MCLSCVSHDCPSPRLIGSERLQRMRRAKIPLERLLELEVHEGAEADDNLVRHAVMDIRSRPLSLHTHTRTRSSPRR